MRSLRTSKPAKENLDPIIAIKQKENSNIYHLINENGSLTEVCFRFFTKVFQINRSKVFRSIKSSERNPNVTERRGGPKNRRTHYSDIMHLKNFINKFVAYESPNVSNMKYLHPRLNIRRMFKLYSEDCVFKQRKGVCETLFRKILLRDFNLTLFTRSNQCKVCHSSKKVPGRFVMNEKMVASLEDKLIDNRRVIRCVKNDLINSVKKAQIPAGKTEVLTLNSLLFSIVFWPTIFSVALSVFCSFWMFAYFIKIIKEINYKRSMNRFTFVFL